MANDAEPYIAAVAEACATAGLIVADYWSDDIDPRNGGINLVTRPDADPDADWGATRTLGWDEEKGWMWGKPRGPHGALHNLLWLGGSALPQPAAIAEQARRVMAGELTPEQLRPLRAQPLWRDQEDDDDFDSQLTAYQHEGR